MPSIFDAATLVVYRVVGPDPARTVRNSIYTLALDDPAIRRDFQFVNDKVPILVRISLPLAVHQADHDAWKHVEYLKERLCEKELDCHWAYAPYKDKDPNAKDRSRHVSYTLTLVTSTEQPAGRYRVSGDPNLKNESYRLLIINAALKKCGIGARVKEVFEPAKSASRYAKGRITLDSPSQVPALVDAGVIESIQMQFSKYDVQFHHRHGSITPTTCTTIGLILKGLRSVTKNDILDSLETIATINNLRVSKENPDYLLCDPCDITVAQGLCEVPVANADGRFFRQIYFANANPANYTKEHEIRYREQAAQLFEAGEERTSFDTNVTDPGPFEPLLLEIAPHEHPAREKPSELQNLRHSQLTKVYNWRMDQGKNKELDPRQMVQSLYRTNVRIAEITKAGSEHNTGAVVLYRHDVDALETQISIHQATVILDARHTWAKDRLEVISRVVTRLMMKEELKTAKHQMLHGASVGILTLRHPSVIPGELGAGMTLSEGQAEYRKLIEQSEKSRTKRA